MQFQKVTVHFRIFTMFVEATLAQDDNEMEIFSTSTFQWLALPQQEGWIASLWQTLCSWSHQPYQHSGTLHTTGAVIYSLYSPLSGTEDEKLPQNLFVTLKLYSQVPLYVAYSVLHSQERCTEVGYIINGELEFPWSSALLLPAPSQ